MTACKIVDCRINDTTFRIIIKCLNHRFINIDIKLPDFLMPLENSIRDKIISRISRGSVYFSIYVAADNKLVSDVDVQYLKKLVNYMKKNSINISKVSLSDIITLTNRVNIIKVDDSLKITILKVVDKIIDDLIKQKEKEGAKMQAVMIKLLNQVGKETKKIEKLIPIIERRKQKIFMEKLSNLDSKLKPRQGYNELKRTIIGLFLQKSFFEEIERLKAHIQHCRKQLLKNVSAKELDFLSQEMHREITTLLNKAENVEVSHIGVRIKKYIEDTREILNNIE